MSALSSLIASGTKLWLDSIDPDLVKRNRVLALDQLSAACAPPTVTLTFTPRQSPAARDAMWRGAQTRKSLASFKSVYSIFVSRVDVYSEKYLPKLSAKAQGQVGIVNAK